MTMNATKFEVLSTNIKIFMIDWVEKIFFKVECFNWVKETLFNLIRRKLIGDVIWSDS